MTAWVRAEDLIPSALLNGDLRIKVNPSCAQEIASVALQLQLDEYAEVKFPRRGAVMPTAPICGNSTCKDEGQWWRMNGLPDSDSERSRYQDALRDPELWDIQAEERTAWDSAVTLHEGPFEYLRPLVVPFVVAMPHVQFPPGYKVSSVFYNDLQSNVTSAKHVYRYTALVTFSNGRLTKVPAGYTTFHPTPPSASAQPKSFANVTLSYDERRDGWLGACGSFWSAEDRAEEHTVQIDLAGGSIYHHGDMIRANVTFYDNTSSISSLWASIGQERNQKWARARAEASGSDAFSAGYRDEHNFGFDLISTSSCRYNYIFGTEDHRCSFRKDDFKRLDTASFQVVGFHLKVDENVVPNFQMHYTDVESFIKITVDIPFPLAVQTCLNPQQDAPPTSDAEQAEELMWDTYSPVGRSALYDLLTYEYQLSARIPITILPDGKFSTDTPSEPPRHYLDPEGTPSPVLLTAAPASLAEVAFPMAHPTISAKSVEEIAQRMLDAPVRVSHFDEFSAGPADDYYAGSYAGVLWEKKVIAGIREQSPATTEETQVQGEKSWFAGNSESMAAQEVFAAPV
ncbi:hypothetical protein HWV62_42745 [Athelia sp. TMB]|nr:hypothetical protein HWV62_42745 [Athelia sp. TMB]